MKKVILVTGGNRGIGEEICRQLGELGHDVLLGSRNLDAGIKVANKMSEYVEAIELDVAKSESIQKEASHIEKKYGKLDVLINNAGIMSEKSTLDSDIEVAKQTFDTNLFGAWELSQACLSLLKKSADGRIINMSSGMGALNDMNGRYAAYRLSKLAMNGLTKKFAAELSPYKIKVNSMCPGWVRTDMGGAGAHRNVSQGADTAVWLATEDKIPNGKFLRDRKEISW